jgi:septal ring factor EnvC (AmiA/AmiB activator)
VTDTTPESRVHAAADEIEREGGRPTVSSVRQRAGVSNADATRFLRGWRDGKESSGATIAALPAALVEQSQRVAGMMWAEASKLAGASHAALEREWHERTAQQDQEIAELVENLDTAESAAAAAAEKHVTEKTALEAELEALRAEKHQSLSDLQETRSELSSLEKQIVEERATSETLRTTINALIARIPAADEKE